jgi:hypothetical protein
MRSGSAPGLLPQRGNVLFPLVLCLLLPWYNAENVFTDVLMYENHGKNPYLFCLSAMRGAVYALDGQVPGL